MAALGLALPQTAVAEAARVIGHHDIIAEVQGFGGLSALEVSDDGQTFVALSDRADMFRGQFRRDEAGAVTGLEVLEKAHLREANGRRTNNERVDSEGLALLPDGRIFVSFELDHRLGQFNADGSLVAEVAPPDAVLALEPNSGLEALAAAPDGTLLAIAEGWARGREDRAVYRYRDGAWSVAFMLKGADYWRPVGADVGPDGRLYVLERDFWGLLGFRSRLLRMEADGPSAAEVLWETRLGDFPNLEGVAIWRDPDGALHATLIADNNNSVLLDAGIVDLALPD
jgi:hypothetical protein